MRKGSLVVLLSLIVVMAVAGNRSLRQMKAIAKERLKPMVATRAADDLRLETLYESKTLVMIGDTTAGFVIVTRDDRQMPVVGVSASPFSPSEMPDAFRWWLRTASKNLLDDIVQNPHYVPAVPNFLKTEWHQNTPYNGKCPKDGMSTCPTGCVATALAQIMKYYTYPTQGKGTGSYTVGSSIITHKGLINNTYEWQKMLASYGNSSGTSNKQAVQQLMYDCGLAVDMHYSKDGSSSYIYKAAQALSRHFSYDSLAVRYFMRDYYSDEEWTEMVYSELALGRPILYGGLDEINGSGHAFLLTGNDEEGKVYVNWGWGKGPNGKSYDGYFSLDAMTLGTTYTFNSSQEMVTGIRPQEKPDAQDELISLWTTSEPYLLKVLGKNALEVAITDFYNSHILYFSGQLLYRFRRLTDNRTEFFTMMDLGRNKVGTFYGYAPDEEEYERDTIDVQTLQAGTYEFCIVSKAVGEAVPKEMRTFGGPCYFYLVKSGDGTILIDGDETAITRVPSAAKEDGPIYDLGGHRREAQHGSMSTGIYIRNGRKIVIK